MTGDNTLVARVQNLDATNRAAAAGLMIRQDTSPESAYAFLALTREGIRLDSRQEGSSEVAHVEGPSASAPVWLELDKRGGSIYAYESGDGVNWTLVTTVALTLSGPSQFGIATRAQTSAVAISADQIKVVEISTIVPEFTASTLSGPAPLAVEFDASSTQTDNSVNYRWDFGDNYTAEGMQATHTYEKPGEYAAVLLIEQGEVMQTNIQIITVTGAEPPTILQIPFLIDTDEIGIGTRIFSPGFGEVYLDSATTLSVSNPLQNEIDFYSLVSPLGIGIATDVVIPGVKDSIVFNAENSIRAQALFMPEFTEVPNNLLAKFYEAFPTHPKFSVLAEQLREVKELYKLDISARNMLHEMALDVARNVLEEEGLAPPRSDSQSPSLKPEQNLVLTSIF